MLLRGVPYLGDVLARAHLSAEEGEVHTHEDVRRALEKATAHLEGASAPADLERSVAVFRKDLTGVAEGDQSARAQEEA